MCATALSSGTGMALPWCARCAAEMTRADGRPGGLVSNEAADVVGIDVKMDGKM